MEKSWNCIFEFLWEPCVFYLISLLCAELAQNLKPFFLNGKYLDLLASDLADQSLYCLQSRDVDEGSVQNLCIYTH